MALDEAELEALYTRLEKPLYNVAYRWVWQREDAADIVQDAFVKLWDMRDRVRMDTVEPLAYRITINLASNRRRKRRVLRWMGLDSAPEAEAPNTDAAHSLMQQQASLGVRRAVDALPESHRRVIMLCELGGLSYAQVADVLCIPVGTVGSRRNKAMALLRAAINAQGDPS